MLKRNFQLAKAVALTSPGVSKQGRFRHGAILIKKKKLITTGYNCYKTHPILEKYSIYPYLHAESMAIIRQGLDNCEGMDMYVVRINSRGHFMSSRPCKTCQILIKEAGINQVYYTEDANDYSELLV